MIDWEKCNGLVPAIVQDAATGMVLMLGYMNREALEATLGGGRVVFFSRSRQQLWLKGETSGTYLEVETVTADCDRDALLVRARPTGPTCHLGTTSCFADAPAADGASAGVPAGILDELWSVISGPESARRPESYTTTLLDADIRRVAQKVGEEGVEVALAALDGADALVPEAADLLYHVLVLIRRSGATWDQVKAELRTRSDTAGG